MSFLKTLDKPFYWLSEVDKGIYDAMNKGLLKSKGDWLCFLGCDDILYDKEILMDVFLKLDKSVDVLLGQVRYDFNATDSVLVKRNNGIFKSTWSHFLWVKNTVHHQSVFYNKEIFKGVSYSLDYKILSDYNLNLELLKKGVKTTSMNSIIALCGTKGVSKKYNWNLYQEEIDLKTKLTSVLFKPAFFIISLAKYILKNI